MVEGVVSAEVVQIVLWVIEQGFAYFIDKTEGGTIIQWGDDTDGDGDPDGDVTDIFIPDSDSETVVEKSIIIMSADGTMTVYDESGQITAEDCDTAYSLWVSENGIMTKPLDNYTVTEGLLLIAGIVACFGFVGKLFRRRKVM